MTLTSMDRLRALRRGQKVEGMFLCLLILPFILLYGIFHVRRRKSSTCKMGSATETSSTSSATSAHGTDGNVAPQGSGNVNEQWQGRPLMLD